MKMNKILLAFAGQKLNRNIVTEFVRKNNLLPDGWEYLELESSKHPLEKIEEIKVLIRNLRQSSTSTVIIANDPFVLRAIQVYSCCAGIPDKVTFFHKIPDVDTIKEVDDTDPIYQEIAQGFQILDNLEYRCAEARSKQSDWYEKELFG